MTATVGAQKLSAGTWAIDPIHSSINFSVRHLMVGKIHGRFDQFSGAITIRDDGSPSVSAEVDVNSIDTGNEQREAHIKAPDFFDVAQFPTATFVSTAVRADGDDYVLDGDFTLKGVTKPVAMTLVFNGVNPGMGRGEVAGFDASVVLSRKDFGVGPEMPLDGGGSMVGD
ncbi:MAG: YceI family protein, partial [Mycobacterium sp.]